MHTINKEIVQSFIDAYKELGEEEYYKRLTTKFNLPVLNMVKTIVINLPYDCYCNCLYCIDDDIRHQTMLDSEFLEVCEKTFNEFPDGINEIIITGGTLPVDPFNKLVSMIRDRYPDITVSFNTNGMHLDERYDTSIFKYINLHRNAIDDKLNERIFRTNRRGKLIPLDKARELYGDKLYVRVTMTEDFNFSEYMSLGCNLYLNRMIPYNDKTDAIYRSVMKQINLYSRDYSRDYRRRNAYTNCIYNGIKIRIGHGDAMANHKPNRYPTWLNVVIIHRNGIVAGSWYNDDKVLYKHNIDVTKYRG